MASRNTPGPTLARKIERFIRLNHLIAPGQTLLVAVSGGADSMALLHLLAELRAICPIELVVAHFNHRLRAAEAQADEHFVAAAAQALGLPAEIGSLDVAELARSRHIGIEEAGREARYHFLAETRERRGAQRVALGHTRDDQVETILHHLLRGTGLRGLAGMLPLRDNIYIRPLLCADRGEIESYLAGKGIPFRRDSSNQDTGYLRNRIRQDLLPRLEKEYNRGVRRHLLELAAQARRAEEFLATEAGRAFRRLSIAAAGRVDWPAAELDGMPPALRDAVILKGIELLAGHRGKVSALHVAAVAELLAPGRSGKKRELPGKLVAVRQFDRLILQARPDLSVCPPFAMTLPIPGQVHDPGGAWTLCAVPLPIASETAAGTDGKLSLAFETRLSPAPLEVRSARPGDLLPPHKSRKLKTLWNEQRVPADLRCRLPLIFQENRLLWIPGLFEARGSAAGADFRDTGLELRYQPESLLGRWWQSRSTAAPPFGIIFSSHGIKAR